jgi:hypothetical protein
METLMTYKQAVAYALLDARVMPPRDLFYKLGGEVAVSDAALKRLYVQWEGGRKGGRLALCLDCESCFAVGLAACPACGGRNVILLGDG